MRRIKYLNIIRFDSIVVKIAFEIFGVESQLIFDVARLHHGGDFCVVNLDAGDGMFDDEFAPVLINFGCVGQNFEETLEYF